MRGKYKGELRRERRIDQKRRTKRTGRDGTIERQRVRDKEQRREKKAKRQKQRDKEKRGESKDIGPDEEKCLYSSIPVFGNSERRGKRCLE
jgi:hypothetical protein